MFLQFIQLMYTTCFEIVFPPTEDTKRIRALTPETLWGHLSVTHERNITALLPYHNGTVRALMWHTKFQNNKYAAQLLGNILRDAHLAYLSEQYVIVPIPLSRRRYMERGYNQAERIARNAAPDERIGTKILKRTRHTTPQVDLPQKKRLTNMRNAFEVQNLEAVAQKHILLLDDVTTTGATLREAREVLLHAGAHDVQCVALAH